MERTPAICRFALLVARGRRDCDRPIADICVAVAPAARHRAVSDTDVWAACESGWAPRLVGEKVESMAA